MAEKNLKCDAESDESTSYVNMDPAVLGYINMQGKELLVFLFSSLSLSLSLSLSVYNNKFKLIYH